MATRTTTREPLPLVTEESLLNEAMECPADRSLDTKPLAEERSFAFWQKDIPEEYWSLDAPGRPPRRPPPPPPPPRAPAGAAPPPPPPPPPPARAPPGGGGGGIPPR